MFLLKLRHSLSSPNYKIIIWEYIFSFKNFSQLYIWQRAIHHEKSWKCRSDHCRDVPSIFPLKLVLINDHKVFSDLVRSEEPQDKIRIFQRRRAFDLVNCYCDSSFSWFVWLLQASVEWRHTTVFIISSLQQVISSLLEWNKEIFLKLQRLFMH